MKKLFLFTACMQLVFLCSCSKQEQSNKPGQTGAKALLTVNMTGFIQETKAISFPNARTQANSLSTSITNIEYIIYDSLGVATNAIHQSADSAGANFGTYIDSLSLGKHSMVILASNTLMGTVDNLDRVPILVQPNSHAFYVNDPIPYIPDVFFKKFDFIVAPTDNAFQDVTLDRIVGQLQVDILDAQPEAPITITVKPEYYWFNFTGHTAATTMQDQFLQRYNTNVFGGLILGTDSALTIMIDYPPAPDSAALPKYIRDVRVGRNKRTVVRGYLYGAPPPGSNTNIGVGVNANWDPVEDTVHF